MQDPPASNDTVQRDVLVTDVTLREFGQNVPKSHLEYFSPKVRVQVAEGLVASGVRSLEVLSCVSPAVAPAMARELLEETARLLGSIKGVRFTTLVPNRAGYRVFLELGLGPDGHDHVMGLFFSAVEAHNLANLGRTIKETIGEYRLVARDARSRGIPMTGYISAAFGYRPSPEAPVLKATIDEVSRHMDGLLDMGVRAITLSDLQGLANVNETRAFLEKLMEKRKGRGIEILGYHPHNVSGARAIENSLAAWELGIRRFDASLGGSGGCVTGAPGNQPTEELVRAFHKRAVLTGIEERRLVSVSQRVKQDFYERIPMTRTH